MFRYRFLSALVLIPLVIGLVILGSGWFLALVAVVLMLAGREYAQIIPNSSAVLITGLCWSYLLIAQYGATELVWPVTTIFLLVTLAWATIRFERGAQTAVSDWGFTLAGGVYLGWLGLHFVLLRNITTSPASESPIDVGLYWASFALSCAWSADTGAYAVGKLWGRHKMAPHLSPGKTWEGYLGGIAGAIVCGGVWILVSDILKANLPPSLNLGHALTAASLVSILTPMGDLGESMLKRWGHVKDSSKLIPGHGGMLDRLDTLLWAAVIVYYYVKWCI